MLDVTALEAAGYLQSITDGKWFQQVVKILMHYQLHQRPAPEVGSHGPRPLMMRTTSSAESAQRLLRACCWADPWIMEPVFQAQAAPSHHAMPCTACRARSTRSWRRAGLRGVA